MSTKVSDKMKKLNMHKSSEFDLITGRRLNLSVNNKLLLYQTNMDLWTTTTTISTRPTRLKVIQSFQSKELKAVVDGPWYVINQTIHDDLRMPFIRIEVQMIATFYKDPISGHDNKII